MKTRSALTLAILASAACAPKEAPAPPAPDAAAIRTALEQQMPKFVQALASKDGATFAAGFTSDAVFILPDASMYTGRAEIEKGIKAFIESFESLVPQPITIDRVIVVSDSEAVTFSHGGFQVVMKGKKTAELHNNPFADHWKKEADGVWRIAYEVNAEGVTAAPSK